MLVSHVPSFYKNRRRKLAEAHPGAAFLIPAWPHQLRNGDTHHPDYRQDSHLFYLTGFPDPESLLALIPTGSQPGAYKTILFVQPRDPDREMWEGERYGAEGACRVFGADEAYSIHELGTVLPSLLTHAEKIFYRLGFEKTLDENILSALEKAKRAKGRSGKGLLPIVDPHEAIGELRLFKAPEEIEVLRKSCQITALAHRKIMQTLRPGHNERDIAVMLSHEFAQAGADRLAYGSIVAGGKNAACLHYHHNNEPLRDGDLILIDAGGEYQHYASDITRTFPVGKKFAQNQAWVYDLVLEAQQAAIAAAKPGARLPDLHRIACEVLVDGFLRLGLLKGDAKEHLKTLTYKRFYPHNTSHWMGMDVHDAGAYVTSAGEPRVLEPGMVFTIEPGFYTQPHDQEVPAAFQNIGIRIEDDILITATGCENLTREAPKTREEIESLRAQAF